MGNLANITMETELLGRYRMKLLKRMLALAIFLALAPNPAEAEPPNLIGRWQGEATVLLQFKTETVQTSQMQILEITHHDGQMVRGLHLWEALEPALPR